MSRLHDIEQVAVGGTIPQAVVLGLLPCLDKGIREVRRRISFDICEEGLRVASLLLC